MHWIGPKDWAGGIVRLGNPRINKASFPPVPLHRDQGLPAADSASDQPLVTSSLSSLGKDSRYGLRGARGFDRELPPRTIVADDRRVSNALDQLAANAGVERRDKTQPQTVDRRGVNTGTRMMSRRRPRWRAYSRIKSPYETLSAPPIFVNAAILAPRDPIRRSGSAAGPGWRSAAQAQKPSEV